MLLFSRNPHLHAYDALSSPNAYPTNASICGDPGGGGLGNTYTTHKNPPRSG